jgi:hypothetical protein
VTAAVSQRPRAASCTPEAPRWARLDHFPPRPPSVSWPATRLDRAGVVSVLAAPPFAVDNPTAQHRRLVAAGLLLNWLGAYPGKNWQARWLSAEAGVAGLGWRRVLASWLAGQGHHISWHLDYLSVAMRMAVSADIVRPSLSWLLSDAMGRGALARVFAATRDPGGVARLRSHCDASPDVPPRAATRMAPRCSIRHCTTSEYSAIRRRRHCAICAHQASARPSR